MKIINLFLTLLFSVNCFGQSNNDGQTKQLLNEFIQNDRLAKSAILKKVFYYQDQLEPASINAIIADLYRFYPDNNYVNVDVKGAPFVLSKKEKALIKKIWLSQKTNWDSTLILNAKLLKLKPLPSNYTVEENREYNLQFVNRIVAIFTMPVFLRAGSICIFSYSDRYSSNFIIMKKEKGRWVNFIRKTTAVS